MINKTPVSTPEELTNAIRQQKIGDIIDVTYMRDGKTLKTKATLGKSAETYSWSDENFEHYFKYGKPYVFTIPRTPGIELNGDMFMMHSSGTPKYGMGLQDDEDGRGVEVTDVDEGSNAEKGGLQESDIITDVDGEAIKDVDDLRLKLDARKEKSSVSLKVLREGKTEVLTVRVPRKLKTANL